MKDSGARTRPDPAVREDVTGTGMNMIEKVARALLAAQPLRAPKSAMLSNPEAIAYAVAAINAMREPTGAMLRAGHTAFIALFEEEAEAYGAAAEGWELMIEEALS